VTIAIVAIAAFMATDSFGLAALAGGLYALWVLTRARMRRVIRRLRGQPDWSNYYWD
jgi:hypothetical protein